MSKERLSRFFIAVLFIVVMPVVVFASSPCTQTEDCAEASSVSRRALRTIPQVVGEGQASTLMFAAGSAQQLGLEPGTGGTLRDARGNTAGHLQIALDGSIYVANYGYTATRAQRTIIAAEVYTFSDGDCTYTSIFIQWSDGTSQWTHYTDCAVIVR
jgi:hypothetical protein